MATGWSLFWNYFLIWALISCQYSSRWKMSGVTGIQGNGCRNGTREREQEWSTGTGICKHCCYSSDSSPVRLTELYQPSHWYAIIVKFFLELFLLHKALSNKRLCKTVYWLMSFVIYYNYTILLSSLFNIHWRVYYNCFKIWLNFQCRNNRHLWLKCVINSAPIVLTKTCEICCNPSQLSSFLTSKVHRTPCVNGIVAT